MLTCDRCGATPAGVSFYVGYLESLRVRYPLEIPSGNVDLCKLCFDGLLERWNKLMHTYVMEKVKREC